MKCVSCKEEYCSRDAGTCRECYKEASETVEELKSEIKDLKAKIGSGFESPKNQTKVIKIRLQSFRQGWGIGWLKTTITEASATEEALAQLGFVQGPPPTPQAIVTEISSGEEDDSGDEVEDKLGVVAKHPSPNHAMVEPSTSNIELLDIVAPHLSCEELMCRLNTHAPASKRQRTGKSSQAYHPQLPSGPQTQTSRSRGSRPALTLTTSPRWVVDLPPTVSLMRGDIPIDALSLLHQAVMDDNLRTIWAHLEVERKARSELEVRFAVLESKLRILEAKYAALRTKYSKLEVWRANGTREHEEALTLEVYIIDN
nr:BTB/POZ domain-containing protein At4g08455 [Ipomoea batatas]